MWLAEREPQKMTSPELEGVKRCLSERGVIEAENPVLLMMSCKGTCSGLETFCKWWKII